MPARKRDKQGRYIPLKRIVSKKVLRDDLGRFISTPKTHSKVLKPKSLPAKKLPVKKEAVKKPIRLTKVSPSKTLPKKVPSQKIPLKKPLFKKAPPKKLPLKKLPPKKLPLKKLPPKKLPLKKLPPKKLPLKKLPPKKLPLKKLPPKKLPPKKLPPKKLPPKKKLLPKKKLPPKKKAEVPLVAKRSAIAEVEIQAKLESLMESVDTLQSGLNIGIQSFINSDGTVDGELRISNLPELWRQAKGLRILIATISSAFSPFKPFDKEPDIGGGYWATFGIRFGPQNESEVGDMAALYKRFRGLFQIGTYPVQAWHTGSLQLAITDEKAGLRSMIANLESKRGIPPSVILIRFIWGPEWAHDSWKRPAHYKGEKG
jgi:hypothetical protein